MSAHSLYHAGERPEMAPFIPENCVRVLEIGCGAGGFSAYFRPEGEYWGVEPDVEAAEIARRCLNNVLVGTFDQVETEIPNDYFDLVICNDVIEHMPDHDVFFKNIQSKLRPGGYLMGSVPNVRYVGQMEELLWQRDWQYKDAGILDRTHLRFFTLKSLRRSLGVAGLNIVALEGINPFHKRTGVRGLLALLSRSRFWLYLFLGRDSKFQQFAFVVKNTSPEA